MKNNIGRFLLENYLSFDKVDINFDTNKENGNLILFTGPSGRGKSILLNSIVSSFGGIKDILAKYTEIEILNNNIEFENFSLEGNEDLIIKCIKNDKVKFFIDDKTISKGKLKEFSSKFVKHLHLKDTSEFESKNFIKTLDNITIKNKKEFKSILEEYKTLFKEFTNIESEIKKVEEEEKNVEELKEFTRFEIDKIKDIDPKEGEYEELQTIKKRLSEKDEIEQKINKVQEVLYNMDCISDFLNSMDEDTSLYDELTSQINNSIGDFESSLSDLEDMDIEGVLDRISDISSLTKKYGSIEECLNQLEEKEKKLLEYDNISFTKEHLIKRKNELLKLLNETSKNLTKYRKETTLLLKDKINYYLKFLYLDGREILFNEIDFNSTGKDEIHFELNNVNLETISSGEFNRLRLALLTARTDFDLENSGILFLDEIDANLSGKESESIAKVVTKLAKSYQVFAISHQPQLTSQRDMHYLVEKKEGKSSVRLLNMKERELEISRMISGENITREAKTFAQNLLKNKF